MEQSIDKNKSMFDLYNYFITYYGEAGIDECKIINNYIKCVYEAIDNNKFDKAEEFLLQVIKYLGENHVDVVRMHTVISFEKDMFV